MKKFEKNDESDERSFDTFYILKLSIFGTWHHIIKYNVRIIRQNINFDNG